jgi:hypothetical protein
MRLTMYPMSLYHKDLYSHNDRPQNRQPLRAKRQVYGCQPVYLGNSGPSDSVLRPPRNLRHSKLTLILLQFHLAVNRLDRGVALCYNCD